jgi:hypothetical protein
MASFRADLAFTLTPGFSSVFSRSCTRMSLASAVARSLALPRGQASRKPLSMSRVAVKHPVGGGAEHTDAEVDADRLAGWRQLALWDLRAEHRHFEVSSAAARRWFL